MPSVHFSIVLSILSVAFFSAASQAAGGGTDSKNAASLPLKEKNVASVFVFKPGGKGYILRIRYEEGKAPKYLPKPADYNRKELIEQFYTGKK